MFCIMIYSHHLFLYTILSIKKILEMSLGKRETIYNLNSSCVFYIKLFIYKNEYDISAQAVADYLN